MHGVFLVCSAAYTGYSDCNLDCMVVHGSGGGAGGGGDGGGCTGGCCSTGTYAGATFCNLYCVVVVVGAVVVVAVVLSYIWCGEQLRGRSLVSACKLIS